MVISACKKSMQQNEPDPATEAAPVSKSKSPDAVSSTTLVTDNFSTGTSGNSPSGWTVTNASSTSALVRYYPNSTNLVLKFTDENTAGSTQAKKAFTAQSGIVTVQFKINEADMNKYTHYIIKSGTTWAIELATLHNGSTSGANQINYISVGNVIHGLQVLSPNTWYTIKVVANATTNKFDVYVNGILKASNIDFKYRANFLDAFQVLTGGSYTGVVAYLDDVLITK